MGRQIAIAQTLSDETELFDALRKHNAFYAAPRRQKGANFDIVPLGECEAQQQVIFLEDDKDRILSSIRRDDDNPSMYYINRPDMNGAVIEWNRTRWIDSAHASPGRFYFETTSPRKTMGRTMTTVQRYIRTNYPLRSNDPRSPAFIGPNLSKMVRSGEAQVVYDGGSVMKLVPNQ